MNEQTKSRSGWRVACARITLGLLASAALPLGETGATPRNEILRISDWGGAYGSAQDTHVYTPFTSRTGIPIKTVTFDGNLELLRAAQGGEPPIDVVDLTAIDAALACQEGLIVPFNAAALPPAPGGVPADLDFVIGPDRCGVASTVSSEVILYDKTKLTTKTPHSIADLFDTKNFPGLRALKRDVVGTLEWALIADGVPPTDVYTILATTDGVDRAFAKLDAVRNAVIWWEHGDTPLALLAHGEVVMAVVFGTRAYQAIVSEGRPYVIVWDQALLSANRWAIVKGAEAHIGAREFLRFATDTTRLAALGDAVPYGPARRSAAAQTALEVRPFLPTTPEHAANALPIDAEFWASNVTGLRQRFEVWLAAGD